MDPTMRMAIALSYQEYQEEKEREEQLRADEELARRLAGEEGHIDTPNPNPAPLNGGRHSPTIDLTEEEAYGDLYGEVTDGEADTDALIAQLLQKEEEEEEEARRRRRREEEEKHGLDSSEDRSSEPYLNPHVCYLCAQSLPSASSSPFSRSYQYSYHPFFTWEHYCPLHNDTTRTCFSCHRHEPTASSNKDAFFTLPDNRCICPACSRTMVLDSHELQSLYDHHILPFFEEVLGLQVPEAMRQIPILAVDLPVLNEQHRRESHSNHTHQSVVMGLCMSEMSSRIQHRSSSSFFHPSEPSSSSSEASTTHLGSSLEQTLTFYDPDSARTITTSVSRRVVAILVLSGLPFALTSSILAHETFHAFVKLGSLSPSIPSEMSSSSSSGGSRLSFPTSLSPKLEEGLCELVAYLWLEELEKGSPSKRRSSSSSSSLSSSIAYEYKEGKARYDELGPSNEWLHKYFKFKIESNPSKIYGEGFRKSSIGYKALGEFSLLIEVILNHLQSSRASRSPFPPVCQEER